MSLIEKQLDEDGSNKPYPNLDWPRFLIVSLALLSFGVGWGTTAVQAQQFAYVANCFSNNVSVIDTASNTVTATVPVGACPYGIGITPNGNFVYVANNESGNVSVIATASNTVIATVVVGGSPAGVAVTPNGSFAYVASFYFVSVIDTASNTVVNTVPVGANPQGVAFTPDGAFAYVTNEGSDNLSVIDTSSNTVVATVPAGDRPTVVVITRSPTPTDKNQCKNGGYRSFTNPSFKKPRGMCELCPASPNWN